MFSQLYHFENEILDSLDPAIYYIANYKENPSTGQYCLYN